METRVTRYTLRIAILLMLVLLIAAMHLWALPHIKSKSFFYGATQSPMLLPDMDRTWEEGPYRYRIELSYRAPQQTRLLLYARGCIENVTLNGQNIIYPRYDKCEGNDFSLPTELDLSAALQQGDNVLGIATSKRGLHLGSPVFTSAHALSSWLGGAAILLFCLFCGICITRDSRDIYSGLIVSTALLLAFYQFVSTGFSDYVMDMPGHLEYIAEIATTGQWPKPYEGWQYYQPPLYYTIEAILLMLANQLGSFDTVSILRLFSLACFAAFIWFALLIIRRLISNPIARNCALLLTAFFPSGIMMASRLDSHQLFYPLAAGCAYSLIRWQEKWDTRWLGLSFIMLGLSIATRSNSLILLPLVFLSLHKYRQAHFTQSGQSPWLWLGIVVIIIGLSANFGRSAYYRATEGRQEPYIAGNIERLPKRLFIAGNIEGVLQFSPGAYYSHPFISERNDSPDRTFFWNFMLKSMLVGQFNWPKGQQAAYVMEVLQLWLIAYTIFGMALTWRYGQDRLAYRYFTFALAVSFPALVIYRLLHPFVPSQDYRYIYPSAIASCGLTGALINTYRQQGRHLLYGMGISLSVLFSAASVAFFLAQP